MNAGHSYRLALAWTGAGGLGTSSYRSYGRDYLLQADGKPDLAGSADAAFRGDASRWNPEELLLAALAACHMLSYLHLCAEAGLVVTAYEDAPDGTMREIGSGGRFESVTLRPCVTIAPAGDPALARHLQLARHLHGQAAANCFIAASVNFPVHHAPRIIEGADAA